MFEPLPSVPYLGNFHALCVGEFGSILMLDSIHSSCLATPSVLRNSMREASAGSGAKHLCTKEVGGSSVRQCCQSPVSSLHFPLSTFRFPHRIR